MSDGFEVHADFVKGLLDAEAVRKTTLEQKAGALITTAGSLVTLLFGLVAVITSGDGYTLPAAAAGCLGVAVVLFTAAALLAVLISVPQPYGQTELDTAELKTMWGDSPSDAYAAVTGVRVTAIETARAANAVKVKLLVVATAVELVAVAALAGAVIAILIRS